MFLKNKKNVSKIKKRDQNNKRKKRFYIYATEYIVVDIRPALNRGVTQPSGAPVTFLGQGPSPLI